MFEFWDAVVLTAISEDQQKCYQIQIDKLVLQKTIPRCVYRVYGDYPPGVKIGGGGGTLVALSELFQEFQDIIFSWRILLLHAGGYSQRQPAASVTGKIFTLLPKESDDGGPFTLFQLKLQLYTPFLARMSAGVFLAASDTLEHFTVDETPLVEFYFSESGDSGNAGWNLRNEGFTALAHPSPLHIGRNHGVFVLDRCQMMARNQGIALIDCTRVLQKPSIELMHSSGAVLQKKNCEEDVVYTDSAFYFSSSVIRTLLKLYASEKPLSAELDPYGDFMQPLGRDATVDYLNDNSRIVNKSDNEAPRLRRLLYDTLKMFPIRALVLDNSTFFHIGTMAELTKFYCQDEQFRSYFGFQSVSASHVEGISEDNSVQGCVMHSHIVAQAKVPKSCIIEYCEFRTPFEIGDGCILSNCKFDGHFTLSENVFMTSIPIQQEHRVLYATVVYGSTDDIKLKAKWKNLLWMGVKLHSSGIFSICEDEEHSLWTAKLFPLRNSPEESFQSALDMIALITKSKPAGEKLQSISSQELVSMADILNRKNIPALLQQRILLWKNIVTDRTSSQDNLTAV